MIEVNGKSYSYTTNMRCENTVLDGPMHKAIYMTSYGSPHLKDIRIPDSGLPVVGSAFGNMPISAFDVYVLPSGRVYMGINMKITEKSNKMLDEWKTTPDCKYDDWEADKSKLFKQMKSKFENKAMDYSNPANNFLSSPQMHLTCANP